MAIKLFVDSLDDVSEALKAEYISNPEGGYMLSFDEKLVPERKLTKLQADLDKKKDWVDPTVHSALQTKYDTDIANTDVEAKVSDRVKELKSEWENEKTELTKTVDTYKSKEERAILREAIQTAATKTGVRAAALEDVMNRSGSVFKVVEGKVKAFDDQGNEKFYKGDKEYTPDLWLNDIKPQAGFLFEESVGGGAQGSLRTRPSNAGAKKTALDNFAAGLGDSGQ